MLTEMEEAVTVGSSEVLASEVIIPPDNDMFSSTMICFVGSSSVRLRRRPKVRNCCMLAQESWTVGPDL